MNSNNKHENDLLTFDLKGLSAGKLFALFFSDVSGWALLASNLIALVMAIRDHCDFATLIWLYWFQSVIIGIFNFFKIRALKDSTIFKTSDYKPLPVNIKTKTFAAFFFAFHYGLFHLMAFLFLFDDYKINIGMLKLMALPATAFFFNHLFSFFYNRRADQNKSVKQTMFFPYARIIPMHLTVLLGGFLSGFVMAPETILLIFFLLLKTFADVIMHSMEHYKSSPILPES